MKKIISSTILLLVFNFSFSQYIEGKVLDVETNKPIEGVHVYMNEIGKGTMTNDKGNYYLKFPFVKVKSAVIRFSHVGYKKIEIPYNPKKKEYSVYLRANTELLEEVQLVEKRKLKPFLRFETLTEMKKGVFSFASFFKEGKFYVIGGNSSYTEDRFKKLLDENHEVTLGEMIRKGVNLSSDKLNGSLQVYNLETDSWTFDKDKFRKRAHHRINVVDNQAFILGGKRLSKTKKTEYLDDKIEIFDLVDKNVDVDDTNPHQAVDFASFVYKGNIITMGGSIKENKLNIKQYTNKVYSFNVESGLWYHIGNMPEPKETQGQLIGDKYYLIGGFDGRSLASIESFDLKTGRWKREGVLFTEMAKPALTSHKDTIYIFENGKLITYNTFSKEITEYLIEIYLSNSELIFHNDKLYIIGGVKENVYSSFPSRRVYSIDILELNKTEINNFKTI